MKNVMEIWKDVEGYEGLYQISSKGRVKSLGNGSSGNSKEKILKGLNDKYGYLQVNLYKEGKQKTFKVHRLVAKAFLDNPYNLPQVNHKDEDKTNNCVDNLEWCNCEYNINYGTRTERFIKSKSIPILQFSKNGEFIRRWDGIRQIERELGINRNPISKCCKGKQKTAWNFIWRYYYKGIWLKNHIPLKDKKVA